MKKIEQLYKRFWDLLNEKTIIESDFEKERIKYEEILKQKKTESDKRMSDLMIELQKADSLIRALKEDDSNTATK
jgi:hypothetical protein